MRQTAAWGRSGSGGSDTLSLGEGGVVDTTEGVPVTETLGGRHMQHRAADSQIDTHSAAIVQSKDFLGEPLSGSLWTNPLQIPGPLPLALEMLCLTSMVLSMFVVCALCMCLLSTRRLTP